MAAEFPAAVDRRDDQRGRQRDGGGRGAAARGDGAAREHLRRRGADRRGVPALAGHRPAGRRLGGPAAGPAADDRLRRDLRAAVREPARRRLGRAAEHRPGGGRGPAGRDGQRRLRHGLPGLPAVPGQPRPNSSRATPSCKAARRWPRSAAAPRPAWRPRRSARPPRCCSTRPVSCVSAACLLRIRPVAPPPARAGRARIWPGVTFVARDPYLRPLTLYAAVANLAYTGNLALVVVFLIRVVGLSSAAVGLLMAAGGAGSLLGALLAPGLARAFGTARALVLTSLGYGLAGPAHPAHRPGAPVGLLPDRLGADRRRPRRRQRDHRQLPAAILPAVPARPGDREHALPRLRHDPARRPAGRSPRHGPGRPGRALGRPGHLRGLRPAPAHPPHPRGPATCPATT